MVGAGTLPIFELGLGDRSAEGDVPERRRLGLVGLAAGEVSKERSLRGGARSGVDRLVSAAPVDGQTESAPELLEDLLVLERQSLA
ncbi:unannotated protein [freshwater metagenome]|uniref:Unannotated protein n=1 Tax=freshwater metagenome TaxID=449393 RepID=A0A6J7BR30_9ZZZZ